MAQAELLLKNAHVVTMDDSFQIFPEGAVAIHEGEIIAVGSTQDLLSETQPAEIYDCDGKVLIPGLINSHTHAAMTMLRGLADDRQLDVWLLGYMMPVEREFVTPEFCRLGTLIACAEMIRSGITCFADMYYFEDTVAEAVAEVGMRGVLGQTVMKFPSPDAESYEDSLAATREFIQRWRGHPLIVPSVAPHAPYTCTEQILKECTELALEFDVPLHIHISETLQEVEDWRATYDMPVVPWVKKLGLFEAKVMAAHCVHIDGGEIHTLQHAGAGVSHNPSSNLKLASGFAPVTEMLERGVHVGIGTDGPASNNDLDMFEELRLASFIAKATTHDPTAAPARQVMAMATRLGAKALYLDHLTGSLEVGKRADLVLLDLNTLHSLPHFDHDPDAIYSRLVYATKSTDVTDVMVEGRWLLKDRQLQTVEPEKSLEAAAEYAKQIDAFLIEREDSVVSKLVAIGGAEQEESYEVQIKMRLPDLEALVDILESGDLDVVRSVHYREYDTYYTFDEPEQGRIRYREDEFIDESGEVYNVRYRLTLIGPAAEREFPQSVLLSRSRFIAPGTYSERFYREYFKPKHEFTIHKDRRRWLIRFQEKDFFINIDRLLEPKNEDHFVEIKTRTWSRRDAEEKAGLILELLQTLGLEGAEEVRQEYPDLVFESTS
ncbi:MAG: amidohydrolase family protein [Chloroflexi bacterium]|nr:amidohydrolase family protein [Chloroflexota bacterium]MDK1045628.1 amidohydrolase family protein [Anaerolineales bacterium]MCH8876563.1 amidohydrolase family protein [Chloroflexota bacterium]MCI0772390.1 amidohydrolase family protein [Chloroflexota bacterium]MCI0806558.1 amidohydrolase family protein [Chloroflexota bacterium]